MANEKNLVRYGKEKPTLTHEQAVKVGKLGNKASQEKKKQLKSMQEAMRMLLKLEVKDIKTKQQLQNLGIPVDDINNQQLMLVAMYKKALQGNVSAAQFVRDTSGNMPTNNLNITETQPVIIEGEQELE